MSKIMRPMYAEARAAREAAANPSGRRIDDTQTPVPNPVASARSTIEWWTTQIAKAGECFKKASHQGKSAT